MDPKHGNVKDNVIGNFQTAWNRSVRGLLNLLYETHRRYFSSPVGTSSAKHQIYNRFVKLESKMEISEKLASSPGNAGTYQD